MSKQRFSTQLCRRLRSLGLGVWIAVTLIPTLIIIIIVITAVFLPSYSDLSDQYTPLYQKIEGSTALGRGNLQREKVFIATSIYENDGQLVMGPWGQAVHDLVDILGPRNVYMSVYESNPSGFADATLEEFAHRVRCNATIVSDYLEISANPRTNILSDREHPDRGETLEEVRNRALYPLIDPDSPARSVTFDKLLFINNVVFDPADAADLVFPIHHDSTREKSAACATDFINPSKVNNVHSSTTSEEHCLSSPCFPWFSSSKLVTGVDRRDAARLKGCWGGIVATEGKWFQLDGLDRNLGVAGLVTYRNLIRSTHTATGRPAATSSTIATRPASRKRSNTHVSTKLSGNSSRDTDTAT